MVPQGNRLKDLTGRQFGRLTVVRRAMNRGESVMWRCHCVCGRDRDVSRHALMLGKTVSCGCRLREVQQAYVAQGRAFYRANQQAFEG